MSKKRLLSILFLSFFSFGFFIYRFGFSALNPFNHNWILPFTDTLQHLTGWLYFSQEPWRFPIGIIRNYSAPLGTCIGYTDSIPFLAVFLKMFRFILPEKFHYFGLVLLLNYILQTVFAYFLISKFTKSNLLKILSSIFFLFSSVFLMRHWHCSLMAHWLILASFILYFTELKTVGKTKYLSFCFILAFVSANLHPYLGIMILFLVTSSVIKESILSKTLSRMDMVEYIAILLFIVVYSWYILGYFYFTGLQYEGPGANQYTANLNTFFNPLGRSRWIPGLSNYFDTQYEGSAYLGIGVFVLVFVNFFYGVVNFAKGKKIDLKIKKILPLVMSILFLAVLAVSAKICFNEKLLLNIETSKLAHYLFGVFQSSGRFIWPLFYFIVLASLAGIIKNFRFSTAAIIISFALVLQIAEFKDLKTGYARYQNYKCKINHNKWAEIMKPFSKVITVPLYQYTMLNENDGMAFAYAASLNNKPITSGHLARSPKKDKEKYAEEIYKNMDKGLIEKDTLYIFSPYMFSRFKKTVEPAADCDVVDSYTVCYDKRAKENLNE